MGKYASILLCSLVVCLALAAIPDCALAQGVDRYDITRLLPLWNQPYTIAVKTGDKDNPPPPIVFLVRVPSDPDIESVDLKKEHLAVETRAPEFSGSGSASGQAAVLMEIDPGDYIEPTDVKEYAVVLYDLKGDGYVWIKIAGQAIALVPPPDGGEEPPASNDMLTDEVRVDGTPPTVVITADPNNPTVADPIQEGFGNPGVLRFYAEFVDESPEILTQDQAALIGQGLRQGFDGTDVKINDVSYWWSDGDNTWWWHTPIMQAAFPSGAICRGTRESNAVLQMNTIVVAPYPEAGRPRVFTVDVYPRADGPLSIQVASNKYNDADYGAAPELYPILDGPFVAQDDDPLTEAFTPGWESGSSNAISDIQFTDAPRTLIQSLDPTVTSNKTLNFTVEFSKPVFDFGSGYVTVDPPTDPGIAGGTKTVLVTGSGSPGDPGQRYNVAVSGMTYSGWVHISISNYAGVEYPLRLVNNHYVMNWASEESCSSLWVYYDGTPPDPGSFQIDLPDPGLPQPPDSMAGEYNTANIKVDVSVHATDDDPSGLAGVVCTNDRWEANDVGGMGTAIPSGDSWVCSGLYLKPGRNRISISAYDFAGNTTTYELTVNCSSSYWNSAIDFPPYSGDSDAGVIGQNSTVGPAPGGMTSVAVDGSGNPKIAYHYSVNDGVHGDLRYASWDGATWNTQVVDGNLSGSVGDDVGSFASLELDGNGNPRISYYDSTNGDLMYAKWQGGVWTVTTVDGTSSATDNVGQYSSLELFQGNPRIAYYDVTNKKLKYASYNGSTWTKSTVDVVSGGDVGQYASLALDPVTGQPRIAYYDTQNKSLKYAINNGAGWSSSVVATGGDPGQYCSLAIDLNNYNPRISFYDAVDKDLEYAAWDGASWNLVTVDSADDVGEYSSLVLTDEGLPKIAYYDATGGDLMLVEGTGDPVNPTWGAPARVNDGRAEAAADTYDVGRLCSIALDEANSPHLAYTMEYTDNRAPTDRLGNPIRHTALGHMFRVSGPLCAVTAVNSSPTSLSPLAFDIVFSTPVTGFAASSIKVVGGTAGALSQIVPNDGSAYRLLVTPTGDGSVVVSVPFGAARAADNSGDNQASNTAEVIVDRTRPSVIIDQDYIQRDPSRTTVDFTVVFSEPVLGFTSDSVALGGTAGGLKSVLVTGEGTTYNVRVTGMAVAAGTVIATIPENRAFDLAGNGNFASTSTDNTVWWDGIPPTCILNQAATQSDPTNSSVINFTAIFSEPVIYFDEIYDVRINGTEGGAKFTDGTGRSTLAVSITPTGDPDAAGHYSTYNIAVSGMQTKGTVTCTLDLDGNQPWPNPPLPIGYWQYPAFDTSPGGAGMLSQINQCVSVTSADNSVTYDATPPTCTINQKADQADPTTTQPIRYTVGFSKDVTGFGPDGIDLSGSTADLSGAHIAVIGSGKDYTVEVTGVALPQDSTAPKTVIANVRSGAARDAAGNANVRGTFFDNVVTFDDRGPLVTTNQIATQADSTESTSVKFNVVFGERVSDFVAGDITVGGTAGYDGTPQVGIMNASGDLMNFDVTVSGLNPNIPEAAGNVTVSLAAGVAHDFAGNASAASTSTDNSVVFFPKRCAAEAVGFVAPNIPDNNPSGVTCPLDLSQYSGTIEDLNVEVKIVHSYDQDLTAYLLGPDGTQVVLFTHVGGNGSNFNGTIFDDEVSQPITSGGAPFEGTYKPSGLLSAFDGKNIGGIWSIKVVDDHAGVVGRIDNWCLHAKIQDTDKPVITITGPGVATNVSPIEFSITFDEPVSDLAEESVTVTGGTAGALTPDGEGYALSVVPAGDGPVSVTVAAGAVHDTCGNLNDETVGTVVSDLVRPFAAITPITASPTNASSIQFAVNFSERVTNVTRNAFALTGSASASSAAVQDSGDGQHYTLTVSGMTSPGAVTVSMLENAVTDLAGNLNRLNSPNDQATVQFNGVLCSVEGPASPTRVSPIAFTITFNTAVDSASFLTKKSSILVSGGLAQTLTMADATAKVYRLLVAPSSSGPITVTCQVPAGLATDPGSGNANSPSNTASLTYDSTRVVAQIDQAAAQADPANTSPIVFRAVFSKPVSDFASGDVTISGSTGGTKTVVITDTGDHRTYDIAVSGMTTGGTIIASIAKDVVHDAGGNGNDASLSTDNTVVYDGGRPTVTVNQASGQNDPTNQPQVTFTVVFSEAVTGFTEEDIALVCSNPSLTPVVIVGNSADQRTFSVVVSGLSGSCTVTASIAEGVCTDGAGNQNRASSSTDNSVSVDIGKPTVTICQADGQDDPTRLSPILFSVVFSKPVTGFTATDVTIAGTAAGKKTATVQDSGDHQNYSVRVSGMTCPTGSTLPGTVIATIAAGAAKDMAGNSSEASGPCDNEVSFDNQGPRVVVAQAAGQEDSTWDTSADFVITFGEPVGDFTAEEITLGGSIVNVDQLDRVLENPTGDRVTYNLTVSGFDPSAPGNVTVAVATGAAHDDAGNSNSASTGTDNSVTYFREQCSSDVPMDIPDNNAAGATSTLDLSGFSGLVHDVDVVLDIEHPWDQDLTATLHSPDGRSVVLFSRVGGVGANRANFSGTLIMDESATAISAGQAPFSDAGGYRPTQSLSEFEGAEVGGEWTLQVVDGTAGNAGRIVSWCLRLGISDTSIPTGTITAPAGLVCESPMGFGAVFSEPIIGLSAGDFTVTGGTATGLTGSGTEYTLYVTPSDDGSVNVSLEIGKAHDTCGNLNAVTISASATYDGPPDVTVNQAAGQSDPTGLSPVNFAVVFGKSVTGFTEGDVVIEGTAFGAGSTPVAAVTGSGSVYNVAVSGMTQSGTVTVSVPAGVAGSLSNGCPNIASTSGDALVTYDVTEITTTINIAEGQAESTTALPINYTVHFSKDVVDFIGSKVTLTGTAGGTKTAVVTGSGQDYNVAVSGVTSSGTVVASIVAGAVHDALGNSNQASTSTKNSVWFDDGKAPSVTVAKAEDQPDPASEGPVNFTVTFNKIVVGFGDEASDVAVSGTAFSPGATKNVVFTDNSDSWNVAVSGMDQPGTVAIYVPASVACDPGGKCNDASSQVQVGFDNERPSVTIDQSGVQADPTAQSPIEFTVEFSEPVTGFTDAGVSVSGTAFGAGATKVVEVTGGPTVYNVAVSGMDRTGTVFASVSASVAQDAAGNLNAASTSTDNSVTFDEAPSVIVNQALTQADPTAASPVRFAVTFSESVVGFDAGSVDITGTAFGVGSTPVVSVTGTGAAYTLAVSGMSQSGTVIVSVPPAAVTDVSGNGNFASTSTDNVVTYDILRPDVTVNQASGQADPTKGAAINFTVVFTKPVSDFTASDVTISTAAFVGSSPVVSVAGGPLTFNIVVSGMSSTGVVTASIAADKAHDSIGNGNTASTSSDNQVTYDISGPTVTINKAAGQADPTNASPVNFTAVFSEPVTGFATGDVTISGTAGATTAVVTEVAGGSGTTYSVAVSGMTGAGTVIASIPAGVGEDSLGNTNVVSTSSDNSVAYDNAGLTVTVNQAASQLDPTNSGPLSFTVVFSKAVTDFAAADVTVSGSATGTKAVSVSGSGTTYTVAVSGMSATGTVTASIAAGVAHDSAGNANAAATFTDHTVTYDITKPTIVITKPTTASSCTWNVSKLKLAGTAEDSVAMATVMWSAAKGGSGLCSGTSNWSATGINIVGGTDTFTVTATDAAGNTATDTIAATVVSALPAAGDWDGLAMVSLPIVPYDTDPKLEVGFQSDYWVIYSTAAAAYSKYPTSDTWFNTPASTPGRGFWAGFTGGTTDPVGMVPAQDVPVTIHLVAGWNLIGQPFIESVAWDLQAITVRYGAQTRSLADAKTLGWVKDYAWGWEPDGSSGVYYLVCDPTLIAGATGEMAPWRAYWLKANVECDLIVPAP